MEKGLMEIIKTRTRTKTWKTQKNKEKMKKIVVFKPRNQALKRNHVCIQ